jgi:hypothetical protein
LVGNFKLVQDPGYYVGESEGAVEESHELLAKGGLRKPHSWGEYVEKHFGEHFKDT